MTWQRTFVGVSVLLGERAEDACRALGAHAAEGTAASALARTLTDAPRPVRARALADVAEAVLRDVQEATLR